MSPPTFSLTSFFSTDDSEVACDLTDVEDEERLVFSFEGRSKGELEALTVRSSFIVLVRSKLISRSRSAGADGSCLTTIVSSSTGSAVEQGVDERAMMMWVVRDVKKVKSRV